MTVWISVVLILDIMLWIVDSRFEWIVPLNWQASIITWKEGFVRRGETLNYAYSMGSGEWECEKKLLNLKKQLPQLRKKFRTPYWIKVLVSSDVAYGKNENYISCLQRRFPEIEILECQAHEEISNSEKV